MISRIVSQVRSLYDGGAPLGLQWGAMVPSAEIEPLRRRGVDAQIVVAVNQIRFEDNVGVVAATDAVVREGTGAVRLDGEGYMLAHERVAT